jgi:hypothetical protein
MLCSPLKVNRRFEGTCRLHLEGQRINQARKHSEEGTKQSFTVLYFLAYSSTLKMESIRSSETLVDFQRNTRSYIPEGRNLHSPRCENLKSYILFSCPLLVVTVPAYRSRGPGFDSWEVVGLERGPLSLVRITEELLEWKSSGSGLENRY